MEPLLEVTSKALGTGVPASLKAYSEQVEVRTVRSPRDVDVKRVRYDEISKVEMEQGMTFAKLKVKTRGFLRGKSLLVGSLSVEDAEHAKAFLEERIAHES